MQPEQDSHRRHQTRRNVLKIGLLGDVHGNCVALTAVLDAARREGIDRLILTGDFVGYYYEPALSLKLLDDWDWMSVRGNHEEILNDWINNHRRREIQTKHGSGHKIAANTLSSKTIARLENLPHPLETDIAGRHVMICHGSPWDISLYIYPDADTETKNRLDAISADIIIMGHAHYPFIWDLPNTKVINPGSVGQVRDRIPGACWAVWDTDSDNFSLRREQYSCGSMLEQCKKFDPEIPYLQAVLTRTRDL